MRTLIWYTSVTGFTEQYVIWLGEELSVTPVPAKDLQLSRVEDYDLIIYAGPVHADRIAGMGTFKKMIPLLERKHILLLAVGAAPEEEQNSRRVLEKSLTPEEQENVTFFYLQGGQDFGSLSGPLKWMIGFYRFMLKRKKASALSEDERRMIAAFDERVDHTNKTALKPVLECIEALNPS